MGREDREADFPAIEVNENGKVDGGMSSLGKFQGGLWTSHSSILCCPETLQVRQGLICKEILSRTAYGIPNAMLQVALSFRSLSLRT